jgi:hypothetical protein
MLIREVSGHPAACWIAGEPSKPGMYFTRWSRAGNAWYYLFHVINDSFLSDKRDRMLYFDGLAGSYATDSAMTISKGELTHWCEATGENWSAIRASLIPHTYNNHLGCYEPQG